MLELNCAYLPLAVFCLLSRQFGWRYQGPVAAAGGDEEASRGVGGGGVSFLVCWFLAIYANRGLVWAGSNR